MLCCNTWSHSRGDANGHTHNGHATAQRISLSDFKRQFGVRFFIIIIIILADFVHFAPIQVNGLFTRLPAPVSEAISLNAMEGNVTISHTSGLEVLFSPSGEVTLTVRATLANRLCAPCGNFNGDAQDDLRLPNGRVAESIAEVVDAWKAKDFAGW